MGGVASAPHPQGSGDEEHQEPANYLLGVLVSEKPFDFSSPFWPRLLGLPVNLNWPQPSIDKACQKLVQNNTFTRHFAKLLIHLSRSLQESMATAHGTQAAISKSINGAHFSCVFLKYLVENLKADQLCSYLSLYVTDKDAEVLGFQEGEQNVVDFVVRSLLAFIGNSDINPTTYLLHYKVLNLLLVMMSTQLHSTATPSPKDFHPFLDAVMTQDGTVVGPFVRKLILSYVARLSPPVDAASNIAILKTNPQGVLQRVGSAAASVLLFPYYTYSYLVNSTGDLSKSPLAVNSLLLLLTLLHYGKRLPLKDSLNTKDEAVNAEDIATSALEGLSLHSNPFCQALDSARDTDFDLVDAEGNAQGTAVVRIPFAALYDTLGMNLADESSVLLLYSLIHGNAAFLEYVLVRTDLDTLLLPILETLYNAPRKTPNHIYMLLIILLILSQDSSFNATIHKLVLPSVLWYKERLLNRTSLGSLMVVILIRTVKYNLSKLRDVYLHTNCLAILANMAPHVHKLDAYAAQRLVSLFDMLSRKYKKLADTHGNTELLSVKVNQVEAVEYVDDVPTELHIYTDFLRIVLEIINAILTYALPRNPEVVYALLHRQELFQPFRNHPRFFELIENIYTVLEFFNARMDSQNSVEEWSVEKVLEIIIANARSWRGEGMKMFTQLRFTYEEELHPEEFFLPYVWQQVVSHSGILWDVNSITLFPASTHPLQISTDGDGNDKNYEIPSTPRLEV